MVLSSKYALWTIFAQARNYSPRRESSFAQARVQSPRRGSPLEQVCSLECFRLGEKSFAQAMRYSQPGESIFAKTKIDLALWTTFTQAMNFSLRRGVFRPGEIGLAQAKKNKRNFFFGFSFLNV